MKVLAVGDAEGTVGGHHARTVDVVRPPAHVRHAVLHCPDGAPLALPLPDQRRDVLALEPGRPQALEAEIVQGVRDLRERVGACRGSRRRTPPAGASGRSSGRAPQPPSSLPISPSPANGQAASSLGRHAIAGARGPVKGRVLINSVSGRPRGTPCASATLGRRARLEVFPGGTEGNLPRSAPRQRPGLAYGSVLLGDRLDCCRRPASVCLPIGAHLDGTRFAARSAQRDNAHMLEPVPTLMPKRAAVDCVEPWRATVEGLLAPSPPMGRRCATSSPGIAK